MNREHYNELLARAHAKSIRTFGDAQKAAGMSLEDMTGDPEAEELRNQPLYWCDGAVMVLESLVECEVI